ncbi:MAG: hypothetical protein SVZ03_03090 [Spirochaetota bacterium]|nr:hypothetical protein [Spirochaetota bacterium]
MIYLRIALCFNVSFIYYLLGKGGLFLTRRTTLPAPVEKPSTPVESSSTGVESNPSHEERISPCGERILHVVEESSTRVEQASTCVESNPQDVESSSTTSYTHKGHN